VKTQCPAAAPIPSHTATPPPATYVSFSFDYISRDAVIFDWSWRGLPADTRTIAISIRPDDDRDCDARTELFHPFEEGERRFSYFGLCPDTSHHVEFAIVDGSHRLHSIKKEHFRTLP